MYKIIAIPIPTDAIVKPIDIHLIKSTVNSVSFFVFGFLTTEDFFLATFFFGIYKESQK
jgi:hypothetical protein